MFRSQRISSLSPEPEDRNSWTEACVAQADWPGLCQVMNPRGKRDMMPSIYGGYCYERNFHCMLECFAGGNIQAVERLLPPELAKEKNCNEPFSPAAAHVMIGPWYKNAAVLERAVPDAEKFLERKKSTLLEKAIISFLLDWVSGDMVKGGEDLLAVCKGCPEIRAGCAALLYPGPRGRWAYRLFSRKAPCRNRSPGLFCVQIFLKMSKVCELHTAM